MISLDIGLVIILFITHLGRGWREEGQTMDKIVNVNPKNQADAIGAAVDIIMYGGIIIYPTDTVYGLGADALNPKAVLKIFKIKDRPLDQPLPVAVSGLEMAETIAHVDDKARKLINAFWPGALTIVLEKRSIVPSVVVSEGSSVGLRMPNHAVPLMILNMSGLPLIATSANKHGMPSPLEACEALRQVNNEVDLVLNCGKVEGQSSTIVDLTKTPPQIIREGPVSREIIEKVVGRVEG
ncbi:MAG: L-threonylcarbamoyladenylate synthase [Candidatus Bathyarchaeota archaeon]